MLQRARKRFMPSLSAPMGDGGERRGRQVPSLGCGHRQSGRRGRSAPSSRCVEQMERGLPVQPLAISALEATHRRKRRRTRNRIGTFAVFSPPTSLAFGWQRLACCFTEFKPNLPPQGYIEILGTGRQTTSSFVATARGNLTGSPSVRWSLSCFVWPRSDRENLEQRFGFASDHPLH